MTFTPTDQANYNAATSTISVTVNKANEIITFGALPIKAIGDAPFSTGATVNSPLTILYASSNPGVATVSSGGIITIISVGTTTITASQPGDTNYNAASPIAQMLTVAAATQTITITNHAPASAAFNSQFTVAATASPSGYPVAITTLGGCSGSGSGSATITMTSGTTACMVYYNQAGDVNYAAATQLTDLTTAQKINQAALTITAPAILTYGTTTTLSTAGGSGTGLVTFSAGSSTGCSVTGSTLSVTSASGSCSVTATKAADNNYNAATSIAFTVTLQKGTQTITVGTSAPAIAAYNGQFTVAATASSGLAITYSSGSPSVCTNSGAVFTVISTSGPCVVQFDQAGSTNYNAATEVTENATVIVADGNITGSGTLGMADVLEALRIAAGLDTPTAAQLAHGDVAPVVGGQRHPDGKIDLADAIAILRKYVNLPSW